MTGSAEERSRQAQRDLTVFMASFFAFELIVMTGGMYAAANGSISPDLMGALFAGTTILAIPFLVMLIFRVVRARKEFWMETATLLGFTYAEKPYFSKDALLLRVGHSRHTGHALLGTLENFAFRFYEYGYSTGHGKSRRSYSYSVFELSFAGTLPHLYLNNVRNRDLPGLAEEFLPELSLPESFKGKFRLYGPKGYEIEALTIFTPTLLEFIQKNEWSHDLEIVGQRLYVFREKTITGKAELDEELTRLRNLLALIGPTLSRATLTPVGDLPHSL